MNYISLGYTVLKFNTTAVLITAMNKIGEQKNFVNPIDVLTQHSGS